MGLGGWTEGAGGRRVCRAWRGEVSEVPQDFLHATLSPRQLTTRQETTAATPSCSHGGRTREGVGGRERMWGNVA